MFNFLQIQTHRTLDADEVTTINFIIKTRAYRYVAATNSDWLYPESSCRNKRWDHIGRSYFLMPDPRSVEFTSATYFGYANGRKEAFDEYGRPPRADSPPESHARDREWRTFHAFKGEYARLFGPKRRGRTFMVDRLEPEVDSEDFHRYHLRLESQFPKPRLSGKRKSPRR